MSMLFPGMDPYLETPVGWQGVHNAMMVYLSDYLQPRLQPKYVAMLEVRDYIEVAQSAGVIDRKFLTQSRPRPAECDTPLVVLVPTSEIHESYVTIRDKRALAEVVTHIEVLSPANKYAGPGRDSYVVKQRETRASQAHLVEIDLLRAGPHVLAVPEWAARQRGPYDYLVCVNRAQGLRDEFELYPRGLRDRLPRVRIPLAGEDRDVVLDVQAGLTQTYDSGLYRDLLEYGQPCIPPLSAEDQAWADALLRAQAQAGAT